MPRVFLIPFVITGLLFLPSCSSNKPKACEAIVKASDEYFEKGSKYDKQGKTELVRPALRRSAQIVVNNPECFSPSWVAESQIYLDDIKVSK